MKHNLTETLFGALILFVAGAFFFYAYQKSDVVKTDQHTYIAEFNAIDGLVVGADVRLSGVKVGTILKMRVDPQTYLAVVELGVSETLELPEDTSAQITSDGLLGNKYISLSPGGAEDMIAPGGKISFTQSAVNLEDLIGKAIFSATDKKEDDKK